MSDRSELFSEDLSLRYKASVRATPDERRAIIKAVEHKAGLPRLGTSGAANAYVIFVGSEFGALGSNSKPVYSPNAMGVEGWKSLWDLGVGEPNPHFDQQWCQFRENTTLWKRLYAWLPEALDADPALAHVMFCWANLSVTEGGRELGTSTSHAEGMNRHVGPLIEACHAKIVVATNEPARIQTDRWARAHDGIQLLLAGSGAWDVPLNGHRVLVAKVGHPSRGISRAAFTSHLQALVKTAQGGLGKDAASSPQQDLSPKRHLPPRNIKQSAPVQARRHWDPEEVLEYSFSQWKTLGGTIESPPSGGWYKLLHSRFDSNKACVVIDLDHGQFSHFTNVRIRALSQWFDIFHEVRDGFDPYFPPDRGISSSGRSNRIECGVNQVAEWQGNVRRYLELCRDHWVHGGKSPGKL